MDWLKNIFVTYGPRAAGGMAAVIADRIARATGVVVDPATLTGLALFVYAAVHKAISAKVNPGDAANGRVASAVKVAADNGSTVVVPPDR